MVYSNYTRKQGNNIYSLDKNHYKECMPTETLKKINDILIKVGFLTEEKALLTSRINTNSLRLVIKGTDIGSNGKGVNEIYATASAYAEFMERLENLHLDSFTQLIRDNKYGFYLFPDEKIMSLDELETQKDPFLAFCMNNMKCDKNTLAKMCSYDSFKLGLDNMYVSLPFWDCKDERIVFLPYTIYRPWYGSNGMCAGNTYGEALVQGLSEIFERIVMKRIVSEKLTLPTIPDEYIEKYPEIYKKYSIVKENPFYYTKLIDCSLGGEYPVAGLLLIEKNTGNYGLKLGSHPSFEIAMERTLTEAAQGQDIFDFSGNSFLDFSNENVFSESNLARCYMNGVGQYPYQFFGEKPDFVFSEPQDVSVYNNDELLSMMLEKIQKHGYHVLVRNVSYLGFPAFHIIIPGLSETGKMEKSDYDMIRFMNDSVDLFRNPEKVNEDNANALLNILSHFSYQNYLSFFMHTQETTPIPFEYAGESVHYYQAALSAAIGNYSESLLFLTEISQKVSAGYITDEDRDWLLALIYYLSARQEIDSHAEVMQYLRSFFDEKLCAKLEDCFGVSGNESFNRSLFEKMTYKYKENTVDTMVEESMYNNKKAMIGNMPKQQEIWK